MLDALAGALQLDESERDYLFDLARAGSARPVNLARFVFLDPAAHLLHRNWSVSANTSVAILRTEAGRN